MTAGSSAKRWATSYTGQAFDDEMKERIDSHQQRRGKHWLTIEEPLELVSVINKNAGRAERILLVDCLTLWLSNLLHAKRDIASETKDHMTYCMVIRDHH